MCTHAPLFIIWFFMIFFFFAFIVFLLSLGFLWMSDNFHYLSFAMLLSRLICYKYLLQVQTRLVSREYLHHHLLKQVIWLNMLRNQAQGCLYRFVNNRFTFFFLSCSCPSWFHHSCMICLIFLKIHFTEFFFSLWLYTLSFNSHLKKKWIKFLGWNRLGSDLK